MPITPDDAARLTEEEEELLEELGEGLNEILQGMYNPLDPHWSVKLPLDLMAALGMTDWLDAEEQLGMTAEETTLIKQALLNRIVYLKALLVKNFDEQGWTLVINEDEKYFVISRKA